MSTGPAPRKLHVTDLARVASIGLRTRRLRASLSALGIAIGVAAIVAVLGLSASSQAGLLREIDRLGTNLLTVTTGQTLLGATAELPVAAPGMIARIGPVTQVADTGSTSASVYRSPLIPSAQTGALSVQAATLGLLPVVGATVIRGAYLNPATEREPVVVLGAAAAQRLGIDRLYRGERIWLGGQWFYVAGILSSAELAPEIDSSALIGFPAARSYLGFDGHPTTIYVRSETSQVAAVQSVLGATANPEAPNEVDVSQPSDALTARADAQGALNGLFLGLGAVSLLVGALGVANIMLISVLERRSEIGCVARSEQQRATSVRSSSPRPSCSPCSAEPLASLSAFSQPPCMRTRGTGRPSSRHSPGRAASRPPSQSAPPRASFPRSGLPGSPPQTRCGPSDRVALYPRTRFASCVRDLTPSLRNTLRRWYSTVLGLTNSFSSSFSCATRREICASCSVS